MNVSLLIGGGERVEITAGMVIEPIPEPSTGLLVSLGLPTLAAIHRR